MIFNTISSLGVGSKEFLSTELGRRVSLSNQLSVLLALISIPFALFFYPISKWLGSLILPLSFLYLMTLVCNHNQWYTLSRINLILWGNLAVFIYSLFLGNSMGIHYVFLSFLLVPLVLFKHTEKFSIRLSTLLPILGFVFYQGLSPHVASIIPDAGIWADVVYHAVFFANAVIIVSCLTFYLESSKKYESELLFSNGRLMDSLEELRKAKAVKEKLDREIMVSELQGIQKTVVLLSHKINNSLVSVVSGAHLIQSSVKDDKVQQLAGDISEKGESIAKLLKKLDKIKVPKDTCYLGDVKMLDLDRSEYSD